jgi:hypothetical protein
VRVPVSVRPCARAARRSSSSSRACARSVIEEQTQPIIASPAAKSRSLCLFERFFISKSFLITRPSYVGVLASAQSKTLDGDDVATTPTHASRPYRISGASEGPSWSIHTGRRCRTWTLATPRAS